MSRLFSFFVFVYVIGVAIQLAPQAQAGWDTVPASKLFDGLMSDLPHAAAWPARAIDGMRGSA